MTKASSMTEARSAIAKSLLNVKLSDHGFPLHAMQVVPLSVWMGRALRMVSRGTGKSSPDSPCSLSRRARRREMNPTGGPHLSMVQPLP
uniref:Predicted protein n=1 Tax=Hordeum vulgare subsp. vulgare TaxID=112509 RepID=F2EHQ8_HORVV|nr:predicted protein [Hordeum vulgare subsp. vulgare]